MAHLTHGWYQQECPDGIHMLDYAAGGQPGFGGYLEALEIETLRGPIFLLHEHVSDSAPDLPRNRYRWRGFEDGCELLDAFKVRDREGMSAWSEKPFWEAVNYNDWPE